METKFNLNRPPITDTEINSKKDFGELIKQFKKQSIQKAKNDTQFFKNKKIRYSSIIAGVAVICTVTYFSVFNNNLKTTSEKKSTLVNIKKPTTANLNVGYISPPIKKITIPYSKYIINTKRDNVISHLPSQSKIKIPKQAFVNKQGEEIVGDVEISYREFHNQADIIASGIPMKYDSAGAISYLESAGMIDIKGYQNNEPVFINSKTQITVEFSSSQPSDKYNMYYLDTLAKNWNYLSRDNSLKQTSKKAVIEKNGLKNLSFEVELLHKKTNELQKQVAQITPKIEVEKTNYQSKLNALPKITQPLKPTKATVTRPQFELDVNYKEFPELEAFKNAVFEVGDENKNYTSKMADVTWSSAQISEGPQKNKNYILTLKLGKQTENLIVYPALTGVNYDNALKTYETKFTNYKTLIAKHAADELRLKNEFEAKQKAYLDEQKKLNTELVNERIKQRQQQELQLSEQFKTLGNQQRVMRVFMVSNFGIYNSDCPNALPQTPIIKPIYVINNLHLTPSNVYLVCHNKNIVYSLPYGTLNYNINDVYSLCIIANGNTYLCSKKIFSEVIASNQNTFNVTQLSTSIDNAFDFKKALGLL